MVYRSTKLAQSFSIDWRSLAQIQNTRSTSHATLHSVCPAWDGCLRFRTHIALAKSALSMHAELHALKGSSMKKAKEEMRAEYRRSDFTKLERGKFYKEVAKGTA